MTKIPFEDGVKVSNAKVTIDNVDYTVTPAEYSGTTPFSAYNLNQMQDNIELEIAKESVYDLWSNPTAVASATSFASQVISIDKSNLPNNNLAYYEIIFAENTGVSSYYNYFYSTGKILSNQNCSMQVLSHSFSSSEGAAFFRRDFKVAYDVLQKSYTYQFDNAYSILGSSIKQDNTRLYPIKIIGYYRSGR